MAKRGPKPKWFELDDNTRVNGLVKSGHRWKAYLPDGSMREFREADPSRAVVRFRQMEAQLAGHPIGLTAQAIRAINELDARQIIQTPANGLDHLTTYNVQTVEGQAVAIARPRVEDIDPAELWKHVAEEITRKPQWCAQMSGIEWLAYGPTLRKPEASPTLEEVGQPYTSRNDISAGEVRRARAMWTEFAELVGVSTLRDITPEAVAIYGAKVAKLGLANKSVYHRYNKVKTVLNHYRTTGKHLEDVRRALDCFAVLRTPETTNVDPHPISRANWDTLLVAVKDQPEARAMLLVALNFCFYPVDVARLQWSEMDLDRGTFSAKRGKTKVARVAVIWPETLEALKQISRSEEDGYVFHTVTGREHNDNTVRKWFYDLRDSLGMDTSVQMADIRDGAYTEAVQGEGVEFVHAQILAGHRAAGMADMYVRRNPRMVAKACEAVRAAYLMPIPAAGR